MVGKARWKFCWGSLVAGEPSKKSTDKCNKYNKWRLTMLVMEPLSLCHMQNGESINCPLGGAVVCWCGSGCCCLLQDIAFLCCRFPWANDGLAAGHEAVSSGWQIVKWLWNLSPSLWEESKPQRCQHTQECEERSISWHCRAKKVCPLIFTWGCADSLSQWQRPKYRQSSVKDQLSKSNFYFCSFCLARFSSQCAGWQWGAKCTLPCTASVLHAPSIDVSSFPFDCILVSWCLGAGWVPHIGRAD